MSLLEVNDLKISFKMYKNHFEHKNIDVISGLDLSLDKGEIVAIVGSSGSGKSLLAHSILGILPKNSNMSGKIYFENEVLTNSRQKEFEEKKYL